MPIIVYTIVVEKKPLDKYERRQRRLLRKAKDAAQAIGIGASIVEGVCERQELEYNFCRACLMQPPQKGKNVPSPKWEIVERLKSVGESHYVDMNYSDIARLAYTPTQFAALRYYDAYGDVSYWGTDCGYRAMNPAVIHVTIPDYFKEWSNFLFDVDVDEETLNPFPYLPLRHAITDKKVQLRQIQFLYPETKTMPFAIALDYVRDRI